MRLSLLPFVLALLAIGPQALAQGPDAGTVTGVVTDPSTRAPLENTSVALRSRTDSTRVAGTITGKDGGFAFRNVPRGAYVVECTLIGRAIWRSPVFVLTEANPTTALGTIALKTSALLLDEVEVSSKRSLFNHAVDRKVYNVGHDLMTKGSTASDLLQNIPSVQVDLDGNVSLRGSPDVMILVNGKKSPLMGKRRADVLQQLPAAGIERIEVITNPSARFTPEGTSGIINIVMSKGGDAGLSGDATAHVGAANRHNENFSFNRRHGPLDLFGSYGYREDLRTRFGTDDRGLATPGSASTYRETNQATMRPHVHMGSLGLSWHPRPKDVVELSTDYFRRRPARDGISTIVTRDDAGTILTDHDRLQSGYEQESETGVTAAFQHDFAEEDQQIRIEANVSDTPQREAVHFVEHWRTPAQPDPASNVLLRPTEKQGHLALDYSAPSGERAKLEAGYALDMSRQDIRSDADSLDVALQQLKADAAKTYRFQMDQAVHAAYGTYERAFGKYSALAGLRVEYATVTPDLVSSGERFSNTYAGLYPTLHLNYKASARGEVQLSYSRRIRRPDGDDLNPHPEFTDPYNMEAGNPQLKPESTHSIELGYRMSGDHFSFVPSLYYRYKNDGFTRVTQALDDSTFLRTMANLVSDQSAGFEPVLTISLGHMLQANVNANVFYDRIDASNLGYAGRRSVVSWSGTANLNLTPWATTLFQLSSNYRSARLTPQGDSRPSFVMNVGGRQEFYGNRVSLTLLVSDAFKTQRQDTRLDVDGILQRVTNRRDSRIFYGGLSYHYGRPEKKDKGKPFQYDDQP